MHCLFLGVAKWIVTRLWIEENQLTIKHLEIMQERANKIKVLSDIGRIPNKIATGDGFFGFTADQWKAFILIYATTISAGMGQCPRKISMSWTCPGHVPSKCPVQISHYIPL